ncbi:hypothetical protein BTA51_00015 [Hahella sp. CCB-MM4]|uniref:hypothetical protein n=1 Tax=Hahella sp. (strain CCB-MM4) TaxID=1926491 RepID=UPI000B9AD737|nr:hypothetical protein [Hahella sp. CCB-MM4]OZG74836.1 hypothetical protein BTA51_00015 [Hahella sp. CCB-MM4]
MSARWIRYFVVLPLVFGPLWASAEKSALPDEEVSRVAELSPGSEENRQSTNSLGKVKIQDLPFKEQSPATGPGSAYIVMSMLAAGAIALLWFGRKYLVKQGHVPNSSDDIKYISNRRLNNKTFAYILEVSNQKFLVVENQNHITMSAVNSSNEDSKKRSEQE